MTNGTTHTKMLAALFILLAAFAAAFLLRGTEERSPGDQHGASFSAEKICLGWAPDSQPIIGLVCAADAAHIPMVLERSFGRPSGCARLNMTGTIAPGRVMELRRRKGGACDLTAGSWLPGPLRLLAHGKIRPNSDSAEDLRALPRIGKVRAETIVEERRQGGPFKDGEDLQRRVRGIGPKTLEGIAPLIDF